MAHSQTDRNGVIRFNGDTLTIYSVDRVELESSESATSPETYDARLAHIKEVVKLYYDEWTPADGDKLAAVVYRMAELLNATKDYDPPSAPGAPKGTIN